MYLCSGDSRSHYDAAVVAQNVPTAASHRTAAVTFTLKGSWSNGGSRRTTNQRARPRATEATRQTDGGCCCHHGGRCRR